MDCSMPGLPVHHQLPEFTRTHVPTVMPSNHPFLCRSFLLLPSIFPSIRVFSSESGLHIRWLKYWSFSFSISPSNKYSGLISFRMDSFSLQSKGLSRVFPNTPVQKHQFFGAQLSSQFNSSGGHSAERERQWNFPQQRRGVPRRDEPAVRQPSPSAS